MKNLVSTIRTEHLRKVYGGRQVVSDVSIRVSQGEIVGLLGPNGAGKTTSFYLIVGMVRPESGHIFLDDIEMTDKPMYKRARLGIRLACLAIPNTTYLTHHIIVEALLMVTPAQASSMIGRFA